LPKRRTFKEIEPSLAVSLRTKLVCNEKQIPSLLGDPHLHAILFDLDSTEDGAENATEFLREIRRLREDVALVALSRSTSRALPLKASRTGADEFFLSPPNVQELKIVLTRAIEKKALEVEGRRLVYQVESKTAFCGMVGGSDAMQRLYQSIQTLADNNASIVLRGESGTVKELIAKAIVQSGTEQKVSL